MDKKPEYWRWAESRWTNPDIKDWHGMILTAGVDIGSTSTQAVILADGQLYCYSSIRTGSNSPNSARDAMNLALQDTDIKIEDIQYIIGTGYGRVNVPFSNRTVTEITCHARGANYIYGPTVHTVLDMGGQDCKAIHCDSKGNVTSFLMNDKCAAGTGRGMEVVSDLLAVPIGEIGERSFQIDEEPDAVSSTCVIFAKDEAVSLMRNGWTREKVLAAYCAGMATRVANLLRREGVEEDFAITGGIAKNIGVVRRIEKLLGVKALETEYDTQIAGAIGAALVALDTVRAESGAGQAAKPAGGAVIYYGYEDGSGTYYIKINSAVCQRCTDKPCVKACDHMLLEVMKDDFGSDIVGIADSKKHSVQAICQNCKLVTRYNDLLPCHKACNFKAIEHTW